MYGFKETPKWICGVKDQHAAGKCSVCVFVCACPGVCFVRFSVMGELCVVGCVVSCRAAELSSGPCPQHGALSKKASERVVQSFRYYQKPE